MDESNGYQGPQGVQGDQSVQGDQGVQGNEGLPGKTGARGVPGVSAAAKWATIGILFLVLVVGAGNLWATYAQVQTYKNQQAQEQGAQRRAGEMIQKAICTDVGTMAAIKPPPGSPTRNPSRAYADAEHRAWSGLVHDLQCSR